MPTDGKSLENLVEILEKMDITGAEIKIRDKIYDKVAKKLREVDVSVRFRNGTHDFLIIFECRDKKRKNGPDWIEQIVTKTKDLGANKVIAVSSSGFTDGAIEKANHYNVKLRTLKEISPEEIYDWFLLRSVKTCLREFTIKRFTIFPKILDQETNEKLSAFVEKKGGIIEGNEKFILFDEKDDPKSPNDLLKRVDQDSLFADVILDGPEVIRRHEIYAENKESGFQILTDNGRIAVDHFTVVVSLSYAMKVSPLQSVKEYKIENGPLAQVVKFGEFNLADGKKTIEFVLRQDEKGHKMAVRFVEPEKE